MIEVMFEADLPELGVVRIAKPCSVRWADMRGDERVRLCAACQCKVYNFAEVSSEEARQLLRRNAVGERICARIFKRIVDEVNGIALSGSEGFGRVAQVSAYRAQCLWL